MNEQVRGLVAQIHELEEELRSALHEQKTKVLFEIQEGAIRFNPEASAVHRTLRVGLLRWLLSSDFRNALSAPFIYGLFFPMALFDLCLTIYQTICFRLYRIPRVDRSRYIVIDRHHLRYLNTLERLNCAYCGYGNGLLAYATEITSRTEQYWCPIKHAHKLLGAHKRYANFLDYGDAAGYHSELEAFRQELRRPAENSGS
jgi:hypothetical protein